MNDRKFYHFTIPASTEEIVIHLEHSVFDPRVIKELEEIISKAISNGTWERTTIIPPSPISINLQTGKADPMEAKVSNDILQKIIAAIVDKFSGNEK